MGASLVVDEVVRFSALGVGDSAFEVRPSLLPQAGANTAAVRRVRAASRRRFMEAPEVFDVEAATGPTFERQGSSIGGALGERNRERVRRRGPSPHERYAFRLVGLESAQPGLNHAGGDGKHDREGDDG
jgi:hypothetical protein